MRKCIDVEKFSMCGKNHSLNGEKFLIEYKLWQITKKGDDNIATKVENVVSYRLLRLISLYYF